MNEEQFRTRLRDALGEPPSNDLRRGLEARLTAARARPRSSVLGPLAATLALLTIAGAVGWRLVYQRTNVPATVKRSTVATPLPTAAAVDPLNCRLPVVIMRESGPPGQMVTEPGFVDTRTGQYTKDSSASIAGLPGGGFEGTNVKPARGSAAAWYDEVVKRWLPVGSGLVAPDGRSYVWTRLLPEGSNISTFKNVELHRYDLATGKDRWLWTYAGIMTVRQWDAAGILLETTPPPSAPPVVVLWLVDPDTGTATQQPPRNEPRLTELPGDRQNGGFGYEAFGNVANGRPLYRIGSRQAGDREWVFYEWAPGQRVTIYKGQQGDATAFDPLGAMEDGGGIWFGDFGTHGLWYWDQAHGLDKVVVKGVPLLLSGANSSIYVNPAGSCM